MSSGPSSRLGEYAHFGAYAGYRGLITNRRWLRDLWYFGWHVDLEPSLLPLHTFAGLRLGWGGNKADSRRVAGGDDEWGSTWIEVEYGVRQQWIETEGFALWTTVGVHLTAIRAVEHQAGANGDHGHVYGDHDLVAWGGVGALARIGCAIRIDTVEIGPSIGIGVVSLGGLGEGHELDVAFVLRF